MQSVKGRVHFTGYVDPKYIVNIVYDVIVTLTHDMMHSVTYMLEQCTAIRIPKQQACIDVIGIMT